jgi:hypothetical protein
MKGREKLTYINSAMMQKQIAILAMQETHLTETARQDLVL